MLLSELLMRKKQIRIQIDELKTRLSYESNVVDVNKIINKIFKLEDQFQKYVMIIDKINNSYEVEVGSNTISVATAIGLRRAVKRKIDALTGLINNTKLQIDILDLIEQRATLWEEYIIYDRAISLNDWRTNVD